METFQSIVKTIIERAKKNVLVLVYFAFAVIIETTAVFVVEGSPFLDKPFLSLGLLSAICGGMLFVPQNRARTITFSVLLLVQTFLDIAFAVIFDMTDQYFDFGMFNLRNDAFAILEHLPVDFITFYVGVGLTVLYFIFGWRYACATPLVRAPKASAFFYAFLTLAGIGVMGGAFFAYYPRNSKDKYDGMIEGKQTSAYSSYGMIGNVLGEVGKTLFQTPAVLAEENINDFIYTEQGAATHTPYFGISRGKNVVTILAESLEWYAFLRGQEGTIEGEYPNALAIGEEELKFLYPNLWDYYENSVVMTNFHGREKTDIAEMLSVVGSYPTGAYINYEYAENTLPYTLPNILKLQMGGNISIRSFHNGFKSFYNREDAHPMVGFEGGSPTDMYDMEKASENWVDSAPAGETRTPLFYNYADKGERNLDSEMIASMKDRMFPADQRFYTYITTITMHGMYYDRENLRKENNTKLADKLTLLERYKPTDKSKESFADDERLYYYMTAGLEFDYMLGMMKEDLQAKGLWENTVIVIFGDHNAYYQEMSNYVKGIASTTREEKTKKFTDLYNVPLMIRDPDLTRTLDENGQSRIVDKFTCTADIVPTLLDLLGIKYYDGLYYGNSVFSEKESVLYSRAYDNFIGDGIVRRSVKGAFYEYDGLTESGSSVKDSIAQFESAGVELVEKIEYCDYIFRQDHFGTENNYRLFEENMKKLNGWS